MGFFKKIFNPNLEPEDQTPEVTDTGQQPAEDTVAQDSADVTVEVASVEVASVDEAPVEVAPVEEPESAPTDDAAAVDGDPVLGDHVQAAHAALIGWIIEALAPLRGGLGDDDVHDMEIHVADARTRLVMGDAFINKLRLALDNNMLSPVAAGEITVTGSPTAAADVIPAGGGRLQLVLVSRRVGEITPAATGRALITLVEGTGALVSACYQLDASAKQCFHIGRGAVARQGGDLRVNDIVINDRETDERLLAMNRQVSSAHADIICRGGAFFLKAMPGGCRPEGGAVTRVFHEGKGKELRDTFSLEPLHNGDLIALGGDLLLRFELIS